ncbi:MAG TPA: FkbM family methyltransferase [Oculatellaceae cyanobacterium]|jgi:FkbM family methyltransferase
MLVELACQALLSRILPEVDPKRSGLTIDIGVGTYDFYFQLFDKLRFKTIAVEPLPTDRVRQICLDRNIKLIESCISDVDGSVYIYVGQDEKNEENYNRSSMLKDWFGSSANARQVESMSFSKLLSNVDAHKITCLKIDVEGMELAIIQQLQELQETLLPKVLMFEYGGGGTRDSKKGGWSKEILEGTMKSLGIIRNLGYEQIIIIDLAANSEARLLALKSLTLEATEVFPSNSIYGNIIALRDIHYSESKIATICKPYNGNQEQGNLLKRIIRKIFR